MVTLVIVVAVELAVVELLVVKVVVVVVGMGHSSLGTPAPDQQQQSPEKSRRMRRMEDKEGLQWGRCLWVSKWDSIVGDKPRQTITDDRFSWRPLLQSHDASFPKKKKKAIRDPRSASFALKRPGESSLKGAIDAWHPVSPHRSTRAGSPETKRRSNSATPGRRCGGAPIHRSSFFASVGLRSENKKTEIGQRALDFIGTPSPSTFVGMFWGSLDLFVGPVTSGAVTTPTVGEAKDRQTSERGDAATGVASPEEDASVRRKRTVSTKVTDSAAFLKWFAWFTCSVSSASRM